MKKPLLNVENKQKNFLPAQGTVLRKYCSLYNLESHETCRDRYGKNRAESQFLKKAQGAVKRYKEMKKER